MYPRKAKLTILNKVLSKSMVSENIWELRNSLRTFSKTEHQIHHYYFAIHAQFITVAGKILASQTSLVNQSHIIMRKLT